MSQTGMELLRLETELNFWPSPLNGHHTSPLNGHRPSGCPHGPPASTATTTAETDVQNPPTSNATSKLSHHRHHHHEKGVKGSDKKTIEGYSRTPHSYCKDTFY